MKKPLLFLAISLLSLAHPLVYSQAIDSAMFFQEERPLEMILSSDLKNLLTKRSQKTLQPATITLRFPDSSSIKEDIRIQTRGKFRLENCFMPPLLLNFKNPTSPRLAILGKLKLVCGCATTSDDEQLIIKEYLTYKMFNFLTEKSFRVRLVRIHYDDTRGKIKRYTQYGFLLEDVDEMAARNNCTEVEGRQFLTESTDREQMTLVALFQYMIGNVDWSVPHYHNVKLMRPVTDTFSLPYVVPYDFNHTGLVDAPYALPQEEYGLANIRERLYRGFPRTFEELEKALVLFRTNKEKIWSLVNNCAWLSNRYKKDVIGYLSDFYNVIDNKNLIKASFIDNARRQ